MKTIYKWIASVAALIAAAFFLFRRKPKPKLIDPPVNPVVGVMVEEINADLKEGIESVSDALTDDDPSEKLADLGNDRSRR